MSTNRVHLPALTWARFVAALVVVAYHLFCFDVWPLPPPLARLMGSGPVAVGFFFVLSGFVLGWSRLEADDEGAPTFRVRQGGRRFLRDRFWRLWPLHALAFVVALPTAVALAKKAGVVDVAGAIRLDALLSITMVQALVPGHELAINPPAWSLSAEACFAVVFVFLAPRLAGLGRRTATAGATLGILWVLSVAPGVLYWLVDPDQLGDVVVDHRTHATILDILRYHPVVRAPEFLAGVVLAGWYRGSRAASAPPIPLFAVVGILLVAIATLCAPIPVAISHNGFLLPVFAVVIVGLAGRSGPFVSHRFVQLLGESSFALYLLHLPLLLWMVGISRRRGGAGPELFGDPAACALAVFACVAVGVTVHVAFERPVLRWRHRRRFLSTKVPHGGDTEGPNTDSGPRPG